MSTWLFWPDSTRDAVLAGIIYPFVLCWSTGILMKLLRETRQIMVRLVSKAIWVIREKLAIQNLCRFYWGPYLKDSSHFRSKLNHSLKLGPQLMFHPILEQLCGREEVNYILELSPTAAADSGHLTSEGRWPEPMISPENPALSKTVLLATECHSVHAVELFQL